MLISNRFYNGSDCIFRILGWIDILTLVPLSATLIMLNIRLLPSSSLLLWRDILAPVIAALSMRVFELIYISFFAISGYFKLKVSLIILFGFYLNKIFIKKLSIRLSKQKLWYYMYLPQYSCLQLLYRILSSLKRKRCHKFTPCVSF